MFKCLSLGLCAFAAAVALSANAQAANLTYNYIGNPYQSGFVNGSDAGLQDTNVYGSNLTASFTFDSGVTPTFSGLVGPSDVLSWSLSSGPLSVQSPTGSLETAAFVFSVGNILGWKVTAKGPNVDEATTINAGSGYISDMLGLPNGFQADLLADGTYTGNIVSGNAGSWTPEVSAVPLPASLPMFATALLGLVGIGVKARRKVAA